METNNEEINQSPVSGKTDWKTEIRTLFAEYASHNRLSEPAYIDALTFKIDSLLKSEREAAFRDGFRKDKNKPVCSECNPEQGKWHGRFLKGKWDGKEKVLNPPTDMTLEEIKKLIETLDRLEATELLMWLEDKLEI